MTHTLPAIAGWQWAFARMKRFAVNVANRNRLCPQGCFPVTD